MLGHRKPMEALKSLEGVAPTPFSEIVRALIILDTAPQDLPSLRRCLDTFSQSPDYLWHLIPWRATCPMPRSLPSGYGKQEAISLRLLKRPDLAGRLIRFVHQAGLRGEDGEPFLVDIPTGLKTSPGHEICLIDGKEVRSVAAHIAGYDVSPKAYREFFGLG